MVNIKKFSIWNPINAYPIISSIIFIFSFEFFIQYHLFYFAVIVLTYVILRILGLNTYIKNFINKVLGKIGIIFSTNHISLIEYGESGEIYAAFSFKMGINKYLLKINKINNIMHFNLYQYISGGGTEKIFECQTAPFVLNMENAINKIKAIYFKK